MKPFKELFSVKIYFQRNKTRFSNTGGADNWCHGYAGISRSAPPDYGIYQLFFSIVSIIAVVSCLSYQSAINCKKDDDAASIVVLCIILMVITSLVSTTVFYFLSGYFEHVLNAPGLVKYVFLLPLAIIANCLAYVLGYWLSRRDQFGIWQKETLPVRLPGKQPPLG